jgi:hypothetical protein
MDDHLVGVNQPEVRLVERLFSAMVLLRNGARTECWKDHLAKYTSSRRPAGSALLRENDTNST